ncbi:activated Cdc42 kinase-like isoform X1 [Diaphorina citri]|uniref:Activated Cdc42 kinase-like isoform X1 n=1 Tax=Diaphorina citri TaxID=121845 RepID=A0A1S3DL77_DIACI|nr:activated Cdc42 kinase-like isoform X2 [Diaphorina citri]XP_026687055.1 activated Cdc42 kinase-like isoform X1 [Diaphorina citri]
MADTPPTSPVEEPPYLGLEDDPPADTSGSFDDRIASDIAALDNLECEEEATRPAPLSHCSDHVSCEDLLEFSKDTKGKERGVSSDEVRIMTKIFGAKISPDQCVSILNAVDWNIHRAIKLTRLEMLLEDNHCNGMDRQGQVSALESAAWDVTKAATMLISN